MTTTNKPNRATRRAARRISKKEIYAEFQVIYKAGKILTPYGWIRPVLVNGNEKIGTGVYHFSTLAGAREYTAVINGHIETVYGTCAGDCAGCYGMTGNYRYQSVINSLAVKTLLAREYLDFLKRAIMAQIKADRIKKLRIHATGDFFSRDYLNMWIEIVKSNPETIFWSYTKIQPAENAFNEFKNANIVKSNIDGAGFNYGHIDYVIAIYNMLRDMGKSVYICRCGIDKNQHCSTCTACATCEHVLFIEHSTGYKAEKDPRYNEIVELIDGQDKSFINN